MDLPGVPWGLLSPFSRTAWWEGMLLALCCGCGWLWADNQTFVCSWTTSQAKEEKKALKMRRKSWALKPEVTGKSVRIWFGLVWFGFERRKQWMMTCLWNSGIFSLSVWMSPEASCTGPEWWGGCRGAWGQRNGRRGALFQRTMVLHIPNPYVFPSP